MRPITSPSRRLRRPLSVVLGTVAALLGLVVTAAVASAAEGIDIASYQHPSGASISWSSVHSSGKSFVYIKATEGSSYTNPWFSGDSAGAKAAGIYRGAYAFARPNATAGSAAAQARYFVAHGGTFTGRGDLPPLLDLEDSGGLTVGQLQSWVSTWLRTVQSLTGRTPVIYVSPYFWRTKVGNSTAFHAYPLFVANYGVAHPDIPGGWSRWTFWQYSDLGTVGGIKGVVDKDMFSGTDAQLAAMAGARSDLATRVTESISTTAVVKGSQVGFWGTLSTAGGDARWQPVSLYARKQGSTAWTLVASGSTTGTGAYSFSTVPSGTATYAVRFWPQTGLVSSASPARTVAVVPSTSSTSVSLQTSATSLSPGQSVTVSGSLSTPSGALPGQPVTVYARPSGSSTWRAVGTTTTDDSGHYAVTHTPTVTSLYAARFLGLPALTASASPSRWVTVRKPSAVSIAVSPSQILPGQSATVSGTLTGGGSGIAGQPVTVYARTLSSSTWRAVGRATTTSTGAWSLRVAPTAFTKYATRFLGSSAYLASVSASRVVSVVSALTTRLTLTPSPASVTSGQSVTLSGSLSTVQGPVAGRWLTLYARTAGTTTWRTLGYAKTSATGTWTYTTKPTASTVYAARFWAVPTLAGSQAPARTVTVTR